MSGGIEQVEVKLRRIAWEIAAASHAQQKATAEEIAELEEELSKLKARLEGQWNAQTRLATYSPRVGPSDFICPYCWIADGNAILLRALPFVRPSEDILRCPSCGRDFGISLRDPLP